MALSQDEMKQAYALPAYNYRVEIGGDAVSFAEVSGLSIEYEMITYKESPTESGSVGPRTFLMPGQGTPAQLTLRKGVVRGASIKHFYTWISSKSLNLIEKKDIFIRLCDETGSPVISWKVINAFPVKLTAPSFDAASSEVAVEELELYGDDVVITEDA